MICLVLVIGRDVSSLVAFVNPSSAISAGYPISAFHPISSDMACSLVYFGRLRDGAEIFSFEAENGSRVLK